MVPWGILIQDSTLKFNRRYSVALLIESALLCLAVPLLKRSNDSGLYLASAACGLPASIASAMRRQSPAESLRRSAVAKPKPV